MRWAWKVGVVAGIPVFVHSTFLLIIAWVFWVYWRQGQSFISAAAGAGFVLVLFGCVVLHEFGHALMAKRFGVRTRDITLLPIGGVARLERMPDEPSQELWVALAGPAVNIVIAAGLFAWLVLAGGYRPLAALSVTGGPFVERLMVVNLFLAVFNMLPAFPMDGGRVLRATLAMRLDYVKATQIAATVGQGMALLFALMGLLGNPFLLFIAFFVWIGAAQEASMVQMRTALSGIPMSRAMITDFRTLSPRDPLSRAVDLILAGSQKDFPVVEEGQVVGVLAEKEMVSALSSGGLEVPVERVMHRDFETADYREMLEPVVERLKGCNCRTIPVLLDGALVGLVTMDNIGELISIRSAVGRPFE
jgi:Zn-dependent protease/predicted transcriptional regulator